MTTAEAATEKKVSLQKKAPSPTAAKKLVAQKALGNKRVDPFPALKEIKPVTSFQRAASHLQAHFARDSATKRGSWGGRRARSSFQN